jgi:hypothetical protein
VYKPELPLRKNRFGGFQELEIAPRLPSGGRGAILLSGDG